MFKVVDRTVSVARLVVLAAAAAVMLLLTDASAKAAPAQSSAAAVAVNVEQAAVSRAPCIVTGYSYHAQQQMAKRRVNSDQVENLVHRTCSRAIRQKNGTWKYTGSGLTVIANNNGYVVTVWK